MGWNARLVLIAVGAASVPLADYTVEHLVRDDAVVAQSRDARTRLLQEIRLRSALDGAVVTDSGWTIEVSEDWFRSPPAPPWWGREDFEWLEVAASDEMLMLDPPNRTLRRPGDAVWWYNPTLGVLRARVPPQSDHQLTFEFYTRVNH